MFKVFLMISSGVLCTGRNLSQLLAVGNEEVGMFLTATVFIFKKLIFINVPLFPLTLLPKENTLSA